MKKGYTLVELLAVLVLIAMIAVLALTKISEKSNELRDLSEKRKNELIISSAKSYFYNDPELKQQAKSGETVTITYTQLKNSNYLNDSLIDIKSYRKVDINKYSVCIKYQNYKYTYEIKETTNCN